MLFIIREGRQLSPRLRYAFHAAIPTTTQAASGAVLACSAIGNNILSRERHYFRHYRRADMRAGMGRARRLPLAKRHDRAQHFARRLST